MMRLICFIFLLSQFVGCIAGESSLDESGLELLASELGVPWGMTFVDDSTLVVTEKQGTMKIINVNTGDVQDVSGVPEIEIVGQGGLLDVARSPNFDQNSLLYISYSKAILDDESDDKTYATALATAQLIGSELSDWRDLFVSNVRSTSRKHFGSRIAFDEMGHVFFTHGERGDRDSAQDLSNHAGTVLRLNLDGSIPNDNPFVGIEGAQAEIWSYGHRNPQGLFYDADTQRLWSNEHGPRGGDEINLIEKGGNYGWPIVSNGREYVSRRPVGEATEKEGYISPIKHYTPAIAPSSLILYSGDKFPQWRGALISGSLKAKHLNVVELGQSGDEISESRHLETLSKRIRNVIQSPSGDIYISTDTGNIYNLLND